MNANDRRVPTVFAPDTSFEVAPTPVGPSNTLETRFERLRAQLVLDRLQESGNERLNSQVRQAANEAAALAWVTPYPLLVFPALFEERAQSALACGAAEETTQCCGELLEV